MFQSIAARKMRYSPVITLQLIKCVTAITSIRAFWYQGSANKHNLVTAGAMVNEICFWANTDIISPFVTWTNIIKVIFIQFIELANAFASLKWALLSFFELKMHAHAWFKNARTCAWPYHAPVGYARAWTFCILQNYRQNMQKEE